MNNVQASSPAPLPLAYPFRPAQEKGKVDIQDVVQVLRREGASPEMIIAVKELTI